jgi:hypothetical protein
MTKIRILFAGLMLPLASFITASSAFALNNHSWVSHKGTGSACTRDVPCGSFIDAHAATAAKGVISVLDAGDYGQLVITKAITIRAESVDAGSTITDAVSAWITIAAGPADVVTLEGLHLTGAGGIDFNSGGHLHVVRCVITSGNASGNDVGIRFQPNGAGKLSVTDTVISDEGSGIGGGIVIKPKSGGSAKVNLERVTVNGNAFGIAVDGAGSTNGINMTIANSMIGGNSQDGIIATTPAGGAPIGVLVTNTRSVNNAFGIRSLGSNVTVRVSNSDVAGNGTGLSFSGGGALLTAGNNMVRANGVDGSFSGPVALQ